MKTFIFNNKIFKLGQNARENHLIFDQALKNDWWFHLNDFPSGHLIIESKDIIKDEIKHAAFLVKDNSKYKNLKKIKVCYTQIKNLKKGKTLGEIIINNKPLIIKI